MNSTSLIHGFSLTNMGLKNKDGVDMKELWKDGAFTYLGMLFNGFPNTFMVYSPHGMLTNHISASPSRIS
jgi:cation diffusion facilitator CzcD-associated flavoprotein CzcO